MPTISATLANLRHLSIAKFSAEMHNRKVNNGRSKFVQLVAGFDQSKIQSIGANGIYFIDAKVDLRTVRQQAPVG